MEMSRRVNLLLLVLSVCLSGPPGCNAAAASPTGPPKPVAKKAAVAPFDSRNLRVIQQQLEAGDAHNLPHIEAEVGQILRGQAAQQRYFTSWSSEGGIYGWTDSAVHPSDIYHTARSLVDYAMRKMPDKCEEARLPLDIALELSAASLNIAVPDAAAGTNKAQPKVSPRPNTVFFIVVPPQEFLKYLSFTLATSAKTTPHEAPIWASTRQFIDQMEVTLRKLGKESRALPQNDYGRKNLIVARKVMYLREQIPLLKETINKSLDRAAGLQRNAAKAQRG